MYVHRYGSFRKRKLFKFTNKGYTVHICLHSLTQIITYTHDNTIMQINHTVLKGATIVRIKITAPILT